MFVNNLLYYANDSFIKGTLERELQAMPNRLTEKSERLEKKMGHKKTECMITSKRPDPPQSQLVSKG